MEIINSSTVVVFSSAELKEALENNNGYSYIYFGNDITLESGIKISSFKPNVTINGTYEGKTYTLTDRKTLSSGDTITAAYASILKVTVCNLNVIGYNYYGTIYVPETSSYKNIVIEYNNITYNGPQMSFHPLGLTRFIDCNITISDGTLTVGNEVAECSQIEIGGITTIVHNSKSNSMFWYRNNNPSFTILSNSTVNITSQYRELFYGVNNLTFSILSNSYFSLTTNNGMAYGVYGTGTTNIETNSEFILKQTGTNGNYPTWYSYGGITLNEYSSLSIINNYTGISTSNYNITFSNNSSFILNNPKKVVLYNEKANVINSSSSIPFTFNFSRVNLFNTAIKIDDNISASTLPTYSWYKENTTSTISGKFNSSSCTIESNNFTSEELEKLPALTNFIFANKKIFSIGDFQFRVNALTNTDTKMSGTTGAGNSILISYDNINSVVITDDNGNFTYNYDTPLEIGTIITFNIKKSNDLLYHTKVIQIVYSGELILDSASKIISFKLVPINNNPTLCPRDGDMIVNVIDSRVNSTVWKLYASIKQGLTSSEKEIFNGYLVYKDENGNITRLSNSPTLVYTGTPNEGSTITTTVKWKDDEGILLLINGKVLVDKEYTTNIIWTIEE